VLVGIADLAPAWDVDTVQPLEETLHDKEPTVRATGSQNPGCNAHFKGFVLLQSHEG
jgi:hypothetical protein